MFGGGGAPIGIAVQEFLSFLGIKSDHVAVRTSYYSGIDSRKDSVQVYGLNYVIRQLESEDRLLIVDDVHDTGNSIAQIINDITSACKKNTPDIKLLPHITSQIRVKLEENQITIFMKQINGLYFLTSLKAYL